MNPEFTNFKVCLDCIKGKEIKHTKKDATRSTDLLEIIHSGIYRPSTTSHIFVT